MKLEAILAAMLIGKRFLLVLDGLCGHHIFEHSLDAHWHVFGHGNRILITTQDESVVAKVKPAYIHQVKVLTFQDCWSLLCRSAHLGESRHGNNLRNIGIMIIQKCNKIPMAIKIVGAILRTKEQTKHCSLKALSLGSSLLVNCGFQRDSLRNKIAAMLTTL
jgi:hypothetical protein